MTIDASSIRYAQHLLHKGYGYQNAARIAGVSEGLLRSALGAAAARPRPAPAPWLGKDRPPPISFAAAARELAGPPRMIVHEVATKYGLKTSDLTGPSTKRSVTIPRQEAMFRIRHERGLSLPAVGQIFGGRDHTTILHGIRAHETRLAWAEVLIAAGAEVQPDLFARAA